jgi:aminotransferase in exopolysaccharide biosynthesis
MFNEIIDFIRNQFNEKEKFIPLHEPKFVGNERDYVIDAIDSTYVSSVGKYVDRFEEMIRDFTGAKYAVAVVNGTSALHMSLLISGVRKDDLVITQPFSFIATCNAISYIGAFPVFIDIDRESLGMSAKSLEIFLSTKTRIKDGRCIHIESGKRISACVPMHTFGHPVEIDKIAMICEKYNVLLIEDAAESMGSKYKMKHTGRFGLVGNFSFNGNKTITSGGGGVIITDNPELGILAKHLTTQAKKTHVWEFDHDYIGYNYRMPNINAALACAQMENLDIFIKAKRELAIAYSTFFLNSDIQFIKEPENCYSNYWLNSILFKNIEERDAFLKFSNDQKVMARPSWKLMNKISLFKDCYCEDVSNAEWINERLVNIPSSVILKN